MTEEQAWKDIYYTHCQGECTEYDDYCKGRGCEYFVALKALNLVHNIKVNSGLTEEQWRSEVNHE